MKILSHPSTSHGLGFSFGQLILKMLRPLIYTILIPKEGGERERERERVRQTKPRIDCPIRLTTSLGLPDHLG